MSVAIVGKSAGVLTHSQGHIHTIWEIVLNLQGRGQSQIGNRDYFFGPGTIICQPPNISHTKTSSEGFTDIYIQSSSFSLLKAADENDVIILQDDDSKSFESLLQLALRTFHGSASNRRQLTDALFEAMNQLLLSWLSSQPEESDIERVKNRLIQSFTNPEFTISSLGSEEQYCSDHLRRRFKKATGLTPVEYLTDLRLNFAKKLLKENNILHYTIAEIGTMSGYYDSNYFSRIFKKKNGLSPQEYLASVRT
jgi:AraC-type DNA-binding domain-containing proteins